MHLFDKGIYLIVSQPFVRQGSHIQLVCDYHYIVQSPNKLSKTSEEPIKPTPMQKNRAVLLCLGIVKYHSRLKSGCWLEAVTKWNFSFLLQGCPSGCYCSVTKLCLALHDPMDCSMPSFPVFHYLLEFAHIHVHWVGDAIQPSHALPSHPLSPLSPAVNLSQHQGLFQWVDSSHQVTKALELQHQSFQWILRADFHGYIRLIENYLL